MNLNRNAAPSYFIPVFMIWVALCNTGTIVISIVFFILDINFVGFVDLPAWIDLIIILSINVVSLLLLIPLFKMDPITPFLVSAIIWFVLVSAVYIVFGMYWLLLLGGVQLTADLWFHWKLKKLVPK